MRITRNKFTTSDLPPTNYVDLEEQLVFRLRIEILHNMGYIEDEVYYTKFLDNAEVLDRDYKIWKELQKLEEF